jgi:hypothetical protein
MYVVYAWIMRATHWKDFAYSFMDLDGLALVWYPLVGLVHFAVYCVFVASSVLTQRAPCLNNRKKEGQDKDKGAKSSQNKEGEGAHAV